MATLFHWSDDLHSAFASEHVSLVCLEKTRVFGFSRKLTRNSVPVHVCREPATSLMALNENQGASHYIVYFQSLDFTLASSTCPPTSTSLPMGTLWRSHGLAELPVLPRHPSKLECKEQQRCPYKGGERSSLQHVCPKRKHHCIEYLSGRRPASIQKGKQDSARHYVLQHRPFLSCKGLLHLEKQASR